MSVTPLTNRPVPANGDPHRAMWMWVTSQASQDPLDTDTDQQAVMTHCSSVGCNVIFLDIWQYLGGSNWTNSKRDRVAQFLDLAHRSGIKVYAMAGNVDWGNNQQWVMKNIVEPIMALNAIAASPSKQFDGIVLDVEYWTDPTNYPASVHCPGLCDLISAIRVRSDYKLAVGCFAAFYLTDSSREAIDYNGSVQVDGYHIMDAADFVIVGSYRDTALDNSGNGQPGIDTIAQPWFDYASTVGHNLQLYMGVETTNVSPDYITFFGQGKASMETQLTTVSQHFKTNGAQCSYVGIAVHSYDGWKAMGA